MIKSEELVFDFNKLILHPQFEETLREISKLDVSLPDFSSNVGLSFDDYAFSTNGELVTPVSEISKVKLDSSGGEGAAKKYAVSAYDESINRFDSLEGIAYFTSHSLVVLGVKEYIPINYLTFYFYTRSNEIVNKSKYIKFSKDPEMDSKVDYIKDKIAFLEKATPPKSILLIDGPLIGGDVYTRMIAAIDKFLEKETIPVFFVKNSTSNMVTDNIKQLRDKYNSDMHWSYNFLSLGTRTNFFRYADKNNPDNAKVFCYMKSFNISPQRVEMHKDTYIRYEKIIPEIMDMVHYFMLVQGNINNPQVRPIAVAESYARETLKLVNINKLMKEVGIVPTMNQNRFGW